MELSDKIHNCRTTRDVARVQLILEFQPVDDPEATLGFRRWLHSETSSRRRIPENTYAKDNYSRFENGFLLQNFRKNLMNFPIFH